MFFGKSWIDGCKGAGIGNYGLALGIYEFPCGIYRFARGIQRLTHGIYSFPTFFNGLAPKAPYLSPKKLPHPSKQRSSLKRKEASHLK